MVSHTSPSDLAVADSVLGLRSVRLSVSLRFPRNSVGGAESCAVCVLYRHALSCSELCRELRPVADPGLYIG
jgi:hypothetical protein